MKVLIGSNPDLEVIFADTWEGGVKVSEEDKFLLKEKGIKFHEEHSIPDSDIESEDESGDEDEESSDEDAVNDAVDEEDSDEDFDEDSDEEDLDEDSDSVENSETSGEESFEDDTDIGVDVEENIDDGNDLEGIEAGAKKIGSKGLWWTIASYFFTLVSLLVSHIRLTGNYLFGNPA